MRKMDITDRELSLFNLSDIQRYLKLDGWSIIDQNTKTIVYKKNIQEFEKALMIYIPASSHNIDYFDRVYELLNTISSLNKVSIHEIIQLISRTNNDILKMRIVNPGLYNFSLPLDVASKEVDALKRLFMFGASSEQQARPFYDQATTIGKHHVNQCQFGHTFEGSFGFTINSPIIDDDTQIDLFDGTIHIPFERRVTERIITGFNHISLAASKDDPDVIVNNFESGLNSKMCDAIVDLSIGKTKDIEFMIDWSYQLLPSKNVENFDKIKFDMHSIEITEEASNKLKLVEPFNDIIIGKIVTLHSNKSPFSEEEFPRIAIIKHQFEGKTIEVKLELTKEEYHVAYNAHGNGKTVRVIGDLYRKGNTWRMIDIQTIEELYL